MKLTIERASLLKSLAHVQSVVERRNTIPILSNVLLEAGSEALRLSATDMDLSVVEGVSANVEQTGATTAPARQLKAGATDDNAEFEKFVEFLDTWVERKDIRQLYHPLDVRDRRFLRVVDETGAPVPGAVVSIVDEEDENVRARIQVVDPEGRTVEGMISLEDMMSLATGFSSKEQRFGPLPPGKYKVTATADDGRSYTKPVTLKAGAERKLKIRLK